MAKPVSKITNTLKQIGDIQVTEWDFMGLLNTEIKDLEVARSLKRLAAIQVMDWDFRTVIPVVKEVANQEVDVIDFFKRTANYKVLDWDFKSHSKTQHPQKPKTPGVSQEVKDLITLRLKGFLQYVTVNLIDEPGHAQIKVSEIALNVLQFKLVLVQKDVAMLIGREGHTASAIRSIMKSVAGKSGVQILLQILSHEEDMAQDVKDGKRRL